MSNIMRRVGFNYEIEIMGDTGLEPATRVCEAYGEPAVSGNNYRKGT